MSKILITGATGFIGKHLVSRLHSEKKNIFAVSRMSGDIADKSTWINLEPCSMVIHLAGKSFAPESWENPQPFIAGNINGVMNALEYCRKYKAKLIYLSSCIYGQSDKLPIEETQPIFGHNPYSLSKKMAEELCKFFSDYYGVDVGILRPFNVYGPNQSANFIIPHLIKQAFENSFISVKDIEPRRDYIHVNDLIESIIALMGLSFKFEIFNVGTGVSYSVLDLIKIIEEAKGEKLNIKNENIRRLNEIMDSRASIEKAKNILGWQPKISLDIGIKNLIRMESDNY